MVILEKFRKQDADGLAAATAKWKGSLRERDLIDMSYGPLPILATSMAT